MINNQLIKDNVSFPNFINILLYVLGDEIIFFTKYRRLLSAKDLIKRYRNDFLSSYSKDAVHNILYAVTAFFEYMRVFKSNVIIYRNAEKVINSTSCEFFDILLGMYKSGFIYNTVEVPKGISVRRYGLKADSSSYRTHLVEYLLEKQHRKFSSLSKAIEYISCRPDNIIFSREYKDSWNITVNKKRSAITDELIDKIESYNILNELNRLFFALGIIEIEKGNFKVSDDISDILQEKSSRGKPSKEALAVINNDLEIVFSQGTSNLYKFYIFSVSDLINLDRLITARIDKHKYISAHKYGLIGRDSPISTCTSLSLKDILKRLCSAFPDVFHRLFMDWDMAIENLQIYNGVLLFSKSSLLLDRIFLIKGIDRTEIKKLNSNSAFVPATHLFRFKQKLEKNDINFIEKISQVIDEKDNNINLNKNEMLSLIELFSSIDKDDIENAKIYFYNLKRIFKLIREAYENQ